MAVPSGGSEQEAVDVRTGEELVETVRNGYRHIIIRSHMDINDASKVQGMDPTSVLAPPGHLAILVRSDHASVLSELAHGCPYKPHRART